MLDPRTVPIARGLAPPAAPTVALQAAVQAASILLTGSPSSAPLDPPWRASYARWRSDASRAAQALPRGTHAQRRLERAAWELLGAADAIAEAADA